MTESVQRTRVCGECSLCCTVLRVDELRKLGGTPCLHQRSGGGCTIHARRPGICRSYECLWLSGSLGADDRPDRLGAVVDLVNEGGSVKLVIRQARPGALEASTRLQEIAATYRISMPVRINDVDAVLDEDRRFRVLMPDGVEHHVEGEWMTIHHPDGRAERRRMPWLERWALRAAHAWKRRRFRRMQSLGPKRV